MKRVAALSVVLLFMDLMLASTGACQAAGIFADTTGSDNYTTPEFYGVEVASGSPGESVKSVTYDLSVDADAFFDFDGDANFGDTNEPVLGTLVGLTASDIGFDLLDSVGGNPLHVARLRFNFSPGSFGVGDSFRFAADTDGLVSDPAPGGVFGEAGVPLTVELFGGAPTTDIFVKVSSTRSELALTAVPEPSTFGLLVIAGLLAFAYRRRR